MPRKRTSGRICCIRERLLRWLTTGSAGGDRIDRAAIFVDSRYTLQVRQQTNIEVYLPSYRSPEWLDYGELKRGW